MKTKVREALAGGRVKSVEFYKDGSGAGFTYTDPTGDHGLPCTMFTSLSIDDVLHIVRGIRMNLITNV